MNIAFCYESVLPDRGGCETYIADLARRLLADRHEVHLYACRWDEKALPAAMRYHPLPAVTGPRFLRPWRFSRRCLDALAQNKHDVSVGFDKTWGQDVLYPLGGLHVASAEHNLGRRAGAWARGLARLVKLVDLAHWSFRRLERRQYLESPPRQILANSAMVRRHFGQHYGIPESQVAVVHSAIDPGRFPQHDRPRLRLAGRERWQLAPSDTVGLFVAKNYRLKGLTPLLHAVHELVRRPEFEAVPPAFRLLICGNDAVGPYQRLARRLGVEGYVRFAGSFPDIREAFFTADFLVHPTFYDPCSLVVLEAMACDLPVITSRLNGASELMRPMQEGFVVDDPHDHAHLAWCLAQMLDPARRRTFAQAARRTAQEWTFEHHYQQLLRVFQDVARRKRAA